MDYLELKSDDERQLSKAVALPLVLSLVRQFACRGPGCSWPTAVIPLMAISRGQGRLGAGRRLYLSLSPLENRGSSCLQALFQVHEAILPFIIWARLASSRPAPWSTSR